tara:strand:- start:22818 stop:24773 length:1956 start_codon:yes stop_codon:yes gene_type:complete
MSNFFKSSIISFLFFTQITFSQTPLSIKSPDGTIDVKINVTNGKPSYSIQYGSNAFLEESPLGLQTSIGDFTKELVYESSKASSINTEYTLNKAKVSQVKYHANELVCKLTNPAKDTLSMVFRVSNNDVAFSYGLSTKERNTHVKIFSEATGFNLPNSATTFITQQALPMTGWEQTKPSYEEEYTFNEPLGTPSQNGVGYTFPALFKLANNGWVLISETGVDSHYPGSRLGEGTSEGFYPLEFPQSGENNGLGENYASQAMPAKTPWRTITLGNTLKPIVESTVAFDLVEEMYPASQTYEMGRATWSWIVWQDGSINYDDQVKYIDLAAKLNFEYVLIDNWWDTRIGKDRMVDLVNYAASKNVGVILWYNSNGYWNDAPQTPQDKMNTAPARQQEMAWLQKIGVKGLKVDFFGGDKQSTMQLYEDILTDANNYGLTITFHGCTIPRGWEKMYPNYVTSEAVLASENLIFRQSSADTQAYYSTILPFTRNTVGAMDFAPVFLNKKLSKDQVDGSIRKTTDAFELATSVLYFSPVQHFGLTPNNLDEQPGFVLDFLKTVPTVWDETKYIGGEPGDYCAIARRKGTKWFVAVVNGAKEAKRIELDLPMLIKQDVSVIYDNKDRTAGFKKKNIGKSGKFIVALLPEGGALIFTED